MKVLEQRILSEAIILPGNVLKVDMFLNHQLDVALIREMGNEIYKSFSDKQITKILTVEASGIAIAFAAAEFFNVPVVFAKKGLNKNFGTDCYASEVYSFTKGMKYTMFVSKKFIEPSDSLLIIDDFLANGAALSGLTNIIEQSGARLAGVSIAIEKAFQGGGKKFREDGVNILSLAIIESMIDGKIVFSTQQL